MRWLMLIIAVWLYFQFDVLEQKISLPENAEADFIEKHPAAKDITWEETNGIYEIEFIEEGKISCEYFHPEEGFINPEIAINSQTAEKECEDEGKCYVN